MIGSVTSHAAPVTFNASPVAQRTFPREAYRDQGQPDVSTILDQTPGALVERPLDENFAAPSIPIYPLVRGGLPYETSIGIDGARVSLPSTGTLDLALIPTYVLQQVEIVKGPGDPSGIGGAGGAINFQTAQPTAVRRGMLELEADSRGGQFSDLAYDGTAPGGKFSFATMASVDGSPGPLAGLGLPGNPGSDALRKALLVEMHEMPNDAVTVSETVLATNLDRALAGAYGALLGGSFVSLAPELGARQDERLRFEQVLGAYDAGNDDVELRVFGLDLGDDGYAGATTLSQAHDRVRGIGTAWTHTSGANQYSLALDLRTGSAFEENGISLATFGEPLPTGSASASVRARAGATLHPSSKTEIDLSGGLGEDGARVGGGSVRDWSTSELRLGASQLLEPELSLRGSVGENDVAPPLDVLASAAVPQYSLGLAPQLYDVLSRVTSEEWARGADVGLEWRLHGETTTLSLDLYSMQTTSAFVLSTHEVFTNFYSALWSNAPPMYDEGVELSLVQFKPVGLGFIVQAAMPRTYVSAALPENVAGIPYAQGYGEISYKWPRGSRLSLGILYTGPNNAYGRSAFAALNSNLELSLGSRSKLQLSVENLFDSLDGRLPIALAGVPEMLPSGSIVTTNANVLGPPTVRVMFRQAFGEGRIYEH